MEHLTEMRDGADFGVILDLTDSAYAPGRICSIVPNGDLLSAPGTARGVAALRIA
jgi:hypothetical protein